MAEDTLSTVPKSIDPIRILLVRILNAIRTGGGGGSGTGQSGVTGTGSPEGVVTANAGTIYYATDTGALYVKGSGSGNTGWVALIA